MLRFENAASATASARTIKLDLLLSNLNLAGMRVDVVGIGGRTFTFSGAGQQHRLFDLRPWVSQTVAFNVARTADQVSISLSSFDLGHMTTSTDPRDGFLAPNRAPPDGEGFIVFTMAPTAGAADVSAAARITFDDNPPIKTNQWSAKVIAPARCTSGPAVPTEGSGSASTPGGGQARVRLHGPAR